MRFGLGFLALCAPARGAVRFDVLGSPTEVVSTGRSEVTGTLTLAVRGTGAVTGTSTGGATQIGLIYTNPGLQIDNTQGTGIRLVSSSGFVRANPTLVSVENRDLNGQCTGFISINLQAGATPSAADFIRLEGVRGRVDASSALLPGTDLFVDLQSINDPSANGFTPDRVRVGKSLKGIVAQVYSDALTYEVRITEGFARAFVDSDAANDGTNANDRTDSTGAAMAAPTNSTQIQVRLDGIPGGITDAVWPLSSTVAASGALLRRTGMTFKGASDVAAVDGSSTVTYSFEALNQVGVSDVVTEAFALVPGFVFLAGRCDMSTLTASVTLAPATGRATGCTAPLASAARPRFLEVTELQITSLVPASVVAGSAAFTLTINGAGFTSGSTVQLDGKERAAVFVSASQMTAAIPAADIAVPGNASITVTTPSLGGAVSNARTLTITTPNLSLYCPRLVSAPRGTGAADDSEYTGVALANTSGRVATLKVTAYDTQGAVISGSRITNPVTLTIPAGQQRPLVDYQLFGPGWGTSRTVGWLKIEGDVPQVAGFFLAFNGDLTRLDGADVSSALFASLIFPEIETRGTTLHLANPGLVAAALTIELLGSAGSARANVVSRTLPINGALAESVADLFPGVAAETSDYLRVTSSTPIAGFEILAPPGKDMAGINGRDGAGGARTLYSPQYVVGGPDWRTLLSLVNVEAVAGTVSLKFVADDGTQIGSTRVLAIPARGKLALTDQKLFLDPGNTLRQGYLEISSTVRLVGDVVFGNPETRGFVTALPLVEAVQSLFAFSQVASNALYYTGLALLNPSDAPATAVIQVFDAGGAVLAIRSESIPARGRSSRLLTELFPAFTATEIASGYIVVTVNRNVAAFALFGDRGLTVLSAVPAQSIP